MAVTMLKNANSPYMGNFRMTQCQTANHDGYDLVGLESKEIHSTVNGVVVYAGWENTANHSQGFGQYVCIRNNKDGYYYYYGHLSEIKVKTNQSVKVTDVIGIEGSTGYSTGSHCHYCVRKQYARGNALNLASISGIPNSLGDYNDGYNVNQTLTPEVKKKTIEVELKYDGVTYTGTLTQK